MKDFIKITTIVQAKFYLMQKKTLCFDLLDGVGYACTEKANNIKIVLQPNSKNGSEAIGDLNKFEQFVNAYRPEMYVVNGKNIRMKKSNILDKFAEFLRDEMEK